MLHAVCGKYSTQKIAKISPSGHHRTTSLPVSSQLRHVSTIRKKLVKHQFCFTCLHNMANFGPLTAEIGLPVSGTPANFNFFVSRLHYCSNVAHQRGGQPNFARSLAVSWAGTPYIHFQGLLPCNGILPCAIFTLCPSLAFSCIGSVTARHSSTGMYCLPL